MIFGLGVGRWFADERCHPLDEMRHLDRGDSPQAIVFEEKVAVGDDVALLDDLAPGDGRVLLSKSV